MSGDAADGDRSGHANVYLATPTPAFHAAGEAAGHDSPGTWSECSTAASTPSGDFCHYGKAGKAFKQEQDTRSSSTATSCDNTPSSLPTDAPGRAARAPLLGPASSGTIVRRYDLVTQMLGPLEAVGKARLGMACSFFRHTLCECWQEIISSAARRTGCRGVEAAVLGTLSLVPEMEGPESSVATRSRWVSECLQRLWKYESGCRTWHETCIGLNVDLNPRRTTASRYVMTDPSFNLAFSAEPLARYADGARYCELELRCTGSYTKDGRFLLGVTTNNPDASKGAEPQANVIPRSQRFLKEVSLSGLQEGKLSVLVTPLGQLFLFNNEWMVAQPASPGPGLSQRETLMPRPVPDDEPLWVVVETPKCELTWRATSKIPEAILAAATAFGLAGTDDPADDS
eukprot:TRINITY_DN24560_c0_g1_i1.p1 TRINITY_DN24560_c0_g1~~TRINITY_DN24560_c0_g1_i1.p1  ORF type:complete len:400 (+),score=42.83 TRINITY_DN24560_c0_g1_i1:93-1292(+)